MPHQLTILAPGLLGGSVAQAAFDRKLADRIVLWARRPEARLALAEKPWCSAAPSTPEEAVADADLVVVAAPVEKIIDLVQRIASAVPAKAIVTDVGSVKGELSRACQTALKGKAPFVGSHPMAGGHKTGWENASPSLFVGKACFVTPLEDSPIAAVEAIVAFWRKVGAEPITLSPDDHDEIVAHISHLPQAIATSLCSFLSQKNPQWRNYSGGGLRDTTRIASSDADMWIEIFKQNRDEVLRALSAFQDELEGLHAALANRDWLEVRSRLERGKAYRDGFRP